MALMDQRNFINLFVIIIILTSYIQPSLAEESNHDTLTIAMYIDSPNIDGRYYGALSARQPSFQYFGFLGMLAPGESMVTMPGIAESWFHNEDKTEWTFTLRENVTFHDGSPIDAKAVKYSLYADLMANWELDNLSEAIAYNPIDVRFPEGDPNGDGNVVIFSGNYFPDPLFEPRFSGRQMKFFAIVPYESHGKYTDSTAVCGAKLKDFSNNPISAGPYKFINFINGKSASLERFDDWFGWGQTFTASNNKNYTLPSKDQAFKYIKYLHLFSLENGQDEALRSGEIDVMATYWQLPDLSLDDYYTLNNTEGFSLNIVPDNSFTTLELNIQGNWPTIYNGPGNFPVSQVWFRRAISHATNRTEIAKNAYEEFAQEFDSIFPSWILENYPRLDNITSYYDFDQGLDEAVSILDFEEYQPIGFPDEPDNRFGWGNYANETSIEGAEQLKGRHFKLITYPHPPSVNTAAVLKENFRKIGIYIDVEILDDDEFADEAFYGYYLGLYDSGIDYNTSYVDEPDPEFKGPDWDFSLTNWYNNYEIPNYVTHNSFSDWLLWGYPGNGWYNLNYEVGRTEMWGDISNLDNIPGAPTNVNFSVPDWTNEDNDFIEACKDVGEELTSELPWIPLVFPVDPYAFNSNLRNFIPDNAFDMSYKVAFSFWATDQEYSQMIYPTSSTTASDLPIFGLIFLFFVSIIIKKKRKQIR